jgi:hypothetical protein
MFRLKIDQAGDIGGFSLYDFDRFLWLPQKAETSLFYFNLCP